MLLTSSNNNSTFDVIYARRMEKWVMCRAGEARRIERETERGREHRQQSRNCDLEYARKYEQTQEVRRE